MLTCRLQVALMAAAGLSCAASALPTPRTFNDEVDGFAEFGGTWYPVNADKTGFFATMDPAGVLLPERGDSYFVSRFNGGTFVGIARTYPYQLEAYTTVQAVYDVGAYTDDPFEWPTGSPQFQVFADVNANGLYDPGEQIVPTRTDRPDPLAGTWEAWEDETFIGPDTLTVGGDAVAGHTMGFLFRATQPESVPPDEIYTWAVDDLTLFVTPTIVDNVDNDGTWVRQSAQGFWAAADFPNDGLDPIAGAESFNQRFNSDFNGIEKLFPGLVYESGTAIQANWFMGGWNDGETLFGLIVPGEDDDREQMQLFADIDGNGAYTDGELIPPPPPPFFPNQYRPIPNGDWQEWQSTWVIDATTTTFQGDPVVGEPIGWMFRGKTPPSTNPPIYGWIADSLRLQFSDVEEDGSVVLAAWNEIDDALPGQNQNDRANDNTPDIVHPDVSAHLGFLNGGFEVRNGPNTNDDDYGNLSAPSAPVGNTAALIRTDNDSRRRLDVIITNNGSTPLQLARIHFDYARLFEPGPKTLGLFTLTAQGDLDLQGFPSLWNTENTFLLGTGDGDYADVDADLRVLVDRVIVPGESAAWRWQAENADSTFSAIAIDNIAITGTFSPFASDFGEPFGVLNFFDVLAYLEKFAAEEVGADLTALFGTVDSADLNTFLTTLNSEQ